jgi:GR25 family glycosyltransferase involved in LPS biosynthesis
MNLVILFLSFILLYIIFFKNKTHSDINNNVVLKNIYYINLEQSKNRNKLIKEKLKKYNIKATRFNGINGRTYKPNLEDKQIFIDYFNKTADQRLGVFGCLKSHLNLINMAEIQELEYIVILEDDIIIDSKFNIYLSSLIHNLKNIPNWEVCWLSWGKFPSSYKKVKPILDRNLYYFHNQSWNKQGAIGYILSKNGIKNINNLKKNGITKKLHASDWLLIRGLKEKYFIYPSLVKQNHKLQSDIINI